MKSGMLRRGCAILAIAAICTLFPVSPTNAAVREADIGAQATPVSSWSFLQFVTQIWMQLVGMETQEAAKLDGNGDP